MKRLLLAVLSVSLTLMFVGCAKDLVTGRSSINMYKIENEGKMGQQVLDSQLKELKHKGAKLDAEADSKEFERIKGIVKRLASVSHYPTFPYDAHLAKVDVVNAWCAPGGKIMVYTGLWDPKKGLIEKGNDAQLAAVLAHEMAHATGRHVTESISRNNMMAVAGTVAQVAIGAGSSYGADLFGEIFSSGMSLYLPSYSRKNEFEADRIGLFYMAQAGFDPREGLKLWQKAAKERKDKTSIYASHPADGARAKQLEKLMPKAMEMYEKSKSAQGAGLKA